MAEKRPWWQVCSLPFPKRQVANLPPRRLLLMLLAVLLPATASGQTATPYGDVTIIPDPEQRGFSGHGYTEYGFKVVNRSEHERRVTLTLPFQGDQRQYGDHIRSIRRTVKVGPQADARVVLYQPADPPLLSNDVLVTIDGKKQAEPTRLRTAQGFGTRSSRLILASEGIDVNLLRHLAEPEGGWVNREIVGPERGATPWPESWLGYSRYDGVVVSSKALAALKAEARTALFQYVECGGSLTVLGSGKVADSWTPERNDRARYTLHRPGFGQCVVADDNVPLWHGEFWAVVARSWGDTAKPWTVNYSPVEANQRFPVVENLALPARGLFALIVVFAIVLGPVNLWLLARWKRRIWMLWTVPLISAVTCAAVFGYMVVAEGWSGHLRTDAITVLDQKTQRASTLGWTGVYTPLTPGDGLRFSPETELTLQLGTNSRDGFRNYRRGSGKSCEIDWSDGQRLTRGWVSARVPTHFRLRKSEATRLRVTVRRDQDGGLAAVNGLGAEINNLTVADERGRLYVGGPIAAGAKVTLQPAGKSLPPEAPPAPVPPGQFPPPGGEPAPEQRVTPRDVYRGDWLGQARTMRSSPEKYLAPLHYLADVAGSPFVEDGLPNAGDARRSAVVLGILKEIEP
jgi:hypothetical protein